MRGNFRIRFSCLFSLLLASASLGISVAQISESGPDVSVVLYKPSDGTEVSVRSAHLSFSTITVPAGVNSVEGLLSFLHFVSNSDALGLLYDSNPDLADVQAFKPGIRVRVLQIESTSENTRALAEGFQWKIRYDNQLITSIVAMRGKIQNLSASAASTLSGNVSTDAIVTREGLACVSDVSKSFDRIVDHLEDRDQPMSHEMLSQVHADAMFLLQELTTLSTAPPPDSFKENVGRVCKVSKDLEVKLKGFERQRSEGSLPAWPEARVLTNTIDPGTGKLVQMWQVHYVAQALQDFPMQEHQLSVFSSPAEVRLPEADYVFWATKTGTTNASSDRVTVSVRMSQDSKPMQVEIPVHEKP